MNCQVTAVVVSHNATRCDGGPSRAADHEPFGEDVICPSECRLHITDGMLDMGYVVRAHRLVEKRSLSIQCPLRIKHKGQGLPRHVDQIAPILSYVGTCRHDDGYGLANEAGFVSWERMAMGMQKLFALDDVRNKWVQVAEILTREDGHNAVESEGLGRVDRYDTRVRVWASYECGMHHSRKHEIIGEPRLSGQQSWILDSLYRLADIAMARASSGCRFSRHYAPYEARRPSARPRLCPDNRCTDRRCQIGIPGSPPPTGRGSRPRAPWWS